MSKRTVFTTVTPLPAAISRETVMTTLHDHLEMIDLNKIVQERHPIKAPPNATPEEYHCAWYSLTDKVTFLPGGIVTGKVTYNTCFHDLANGVQTHCYAPMGLNIKGKWTLGGSLPGEPIAPVEIGLGTPPSGLWLREDVDMKCNIMMTAFVKKTLKRSHSALVQRIMVRAQLISASMENTRLSSTPSTSSQISLARQLTSYSQHSSRDSQSVFDNQSVLEDPISAFPPHTALSPRPSKGFRHEDQQSLRDGKPASKALSTRSSSPSVTGSHSTGPTSYQSSTGKPDVGPKTSRSQLNTKRTPSTKQESSYQYSNSQFRSSQSSHDTPAYPSSAHHFQQPSEQHLAFRASQYYAPHDDPVIQASEPDSEHEQHYPPRKNSLPYLEYQQHHPPRKNSLPYPEYQQHHLPLLNAQPYLHNDHIVDFSGRKSSLGQPSPGQQSQYRPPAPKPLELE